MATRTEKVQFDLQRLLKFMKKVLSDKRGVIGVGIIVFFVLLAFIAPILTPYDPYSDTYLGGDYAAPTWLDSLPGGGHYSQNLVTLNDSTGGFNSAAAINAWNISISDTSHTSLAYCSNFGDPKSGPGCVAIEYYRRKGETAQVVDVVFESGFSYPYVDSPRRFTANYSLFVTGVTGLREIQLQAVLNRYPDGSSNQTEVAMYSIKTLKLSSDTSYWEIPTDIDSYSAIVTSQFPGAGNDPSKIVFNTTESHRYSYMLKLSINDFDPDKEIRLVVYLDGINLRMYGTSFGYLGTDREGRDIFTQLVYGTRISLLVGMLAASLGTVIGLFVGVVSGYVGSIVDELLMRFTDMLLVIPNLPLLLVLIAVLGPSTWNLILLIGVLGWMGFARVVRSQTLSLKERPFVEAAKAVGARRFYIISRHIVPNVMSLVYVTLALSVPGAIISEAALSFLGLFDPTMMSWGRMLHDSLAVEKSIEKFWWTLPPGLGIALLSLSFIMIGYAIDDVLNPKLRQRQ
ncbi:ABC transporter permease [Candidatus Bathyarchaeota archaeon]|nr:ABC transporter permease [Candidatus Bathyarchaeota archaeon]